MRAASDLRPWAIVALLVGVLVSASAHAQSPPSVDPALETLRDQLAKLVSDTPPRLPEASTLFDVDLLSPPAIQARLEALAAEREAQTLAAAAARVRAEREQSPQSEAHRRALAEQRGAELKGEITELQHRYLSRLLAHLQPQVPAVLASLPRLQQAPAAQRAEAERLDELAGALKALRARTLRLANQCAAGGLVGFDVAVRELERSLRDEDRHGAQLAARIEQTQQTLERAAKALQQEQQEILGVVLNQLFAPGQQAAIDGLFEQQQRALTLLRRQLQGAALDPRPSTQRALEELRAALATPDAVAGVSVGREAAAQVSSALGRLDTALDRQLIAVEGRRMAVARLMVAFLRPQASEHLRDRHISARLVDELRYELVLLLQRLRGHVAQRRAQLETLPERAGRATTTWFLLRFAFALLLFILVLRMGAVLPRLVSRGVKRLVRSGTLRRRVGAVVRWAGFVERVLPPLLVLGAGEIAFSLMGRSIPEVLLAELTFKWVMLYLLVAAALAGLTQRAGRGRPAVIGVSAATASLVAESYRRLGLPVAAGLAIEEAAATWLSAGWLRSLLEWALLVLLAVWGSWVLLAWRTRFAEGWQARAGEGGFESRLAAWYGSNRIGFVLAPMAMLRLFFGWFGDWAKRQLSAGGVFAWFKSWQLLRRARKSGEGDAAAMGTLPEAYRAHFAGRLDVLPAGAAGPARRSAIDALAGYVRDWRDTGGEGAAIVSGEKGLGAAALMLAATQPFEEEGLEVQRTCFEGKISTELRLVGCLAPLLAPGAVLDDHDVEHLAAAVPLGTRRVLVIDDAHNIFLRIVGGFEAADALTRLIALTRDRIFWCLRFTRFGWSFLSRSQRGMNYLRNVIEVPHWSAAEIEAVISACHARSGYSLSYDAVLLSGVGESDEDALRLVESSDGFFLSLTEASGGNPWVARDLWLRSLTPVGPEKLRVSLFPGAPLERLRALDDSLLFALAAYCQHENLTDEELARVVNISEDEASFAARVLRDAGITESQGTRATLSARYFVHAVRHLRRKHLL